MFMRVFDEFKGVGERGWRILAEREGFEPPIALRLCLISSQVHSTGLCHLSVVMVGAESALLQSTGEGASEAILHGRRARNRSNAVSGEWAAFRREGMLPYVLTALDPGKGGQFQCAQCCADRWQPPPGLWLYSCK